MDVQVDPDGLGSRFLGDEAFGRHAPEDVNLALLGPLAISPAYQNQGFGMRLIADGIAAVGGRGYELVVLIGDLAYYRKAGFRVVPPGHIILPGPADPERLLVCELQAGALAGVSGMIAADNEPPFEAALNWRHAV
ncbi:MAG: N-acetyltransferase [Alphaproteobacteria bacterium]